MSKKLNTSQIVNELHQSKFFSQARDRKKKETKNDTPVVPERVERVQRPEQKTPTPNENNRELKRFSHDLYVDQMETLTTQTKAYFLSKGKTKSNAQLVREAIDEFIKKHS